MKVSQLLPVTAQGLAPFLARALAPVLALAVLASPALADPFRLIVTDLETPLVPNSVMDLALQEGYFDRAGVEVELVRVQQTPLALAALQAGEGEMANISVDALLQVIARGGADLRAVTSPNKSLPYLIAAAPTVQGVEGLAGTRFGVGRLGSLDHSLSMLVLGAAGIEPEGLDIVTLGQPNVRAQALLAGQIDATTMSIGTLLAMPDPDAVQVLIDVDAYYAAAPVVMKVNAVPAAVLETRGDEVEAVIEALVLASRDYAADGALWAEAMARARPDVDRADLDQLATTYAASWSVNGGLQRQELEHTMEWLAGTEDFADLEVPPMSQWLDFAPLDHVLARIGIADDMDMDVHSR
ncbi:ABC transporter substrate-binding protein [Halodurantibacterium flavum]|uniref:ABC transporter substrate-binding protein n=1 Tax=Halodurantibacterium flavum TaxID=1382802 RepID=A0ABW4SBH3_9RHOB